MKGSLTPGRTAVLRGADQRAGRAPTHCVITGESTSGAVQVRAGSLPRTDVLQLLLGYAVVALVSRRSLVTTLPVAPSAWKIWRRRLGVAVVVLAVGAGLAATGIVRGQVGLLVAGVVVLLLGVALRAWFAWVRWVGFRYDPAKDLVIVSRTSNGFDRDAQRLFVAGVHRR